MTDLTERLRNAGRMVDHFRNELVTAREELTEANSLLGIRNDEIDSLAQENERLRAKLATAHDGLTGLHREADSLAAENDRQHVVIEQLRAEQVRSWRPVPAEAGDGPDARPAYKLADGEDWEAIAQWCGGRLVSHEMADSGEYDTELRLPGKSFRDSAIEDDWIVRDLNGEFQVLREVESTCIALLPAETGDSTLPRYFVDLDGHAEPTIWIGTGPDDPNCQPVVRKCTLDGEHPVLWPTVVQALTEQVDPDPEWIADGAVFGTGAGGAR